jgi:glycosyltransferase involved in cell wall biosynthesis
LPGYLKAFNVAINPQKLNEITDGNYPRKIDEYLAMGKPVVATYTQTMEYFRDHVSLASDIDSWIASIEMELDNNSLTKSQHRKSFAAGHTWENNAKNIFELVGQ